MRLIGSPSEYESLDCRTCGRQFRCKLHQGAPRAPCVGRAAEPQGGRRHESAQAFGALSGEAGRARDHDAEGRGGRAAYPVVLGSIRGSRLPGRHLGVTPCRRPIGGSFDWLQAVGRQRQAMRRAS
ncbi:hypothetical protein Mpe_A1367 [Methylibium petroleiphilum PM1]|uniref:Uncharacterized protein n=1 Tax=Methylibium petroleiphilum (strain ATCC BAA-1232 / LMG 22953 / PM1) TaxID=420662 RepID=A2SFJ0_METPP|nr:hypothetical protein Mpe_A1367 [Methylibium petroleiphilum PM1]